MKFALVSQSGNPSFLVKDGKGYLLNGDEFDYQSAVLNAKRKELAKTIQLPEFA